MTNDRPQIGQTAVLALSAIGIVYGDIGTSPLYALRACFHPTFGLAVNTPNILGVLSLIVWALVLVVTLKYLWLVLRADNEGEGGILALLALAQRHRPHVNFPLRSNLIVLLGLIGTALVYGDGIITPALSVLSAVEGLEVETSAYQPYTVPITLVILVLLFATQYRGTALIGKMFGPVMAIWFVAIAALGLRELVQAPEVMAALDPQLAVAFLWHHGTIGFAVLSGVFLTLTGAEALYADMGHVGRGPIRIGWYGIVFPALVLQYLGQGGLLLQQPEAISNPFYRLAPPGLLWPLVLLATSATIIASQAMLTGAFSLSHQAIRLGYLPRMAIRHTAPEHVGQVYIPVVNWLMLVGTLGLVVTFGASSKLAAAYGIAVSGTMVITTILIAVVARRRWEWSTGKVGLVFGSFMLVDSGFFVANVLKIPQGGWVSLGLACLLLLLMSTWSGGRHLVARCLWNKMPSLSSFIEQIQSDGVSRVPGWAIYMSSTPELAPPALVQNVRHNKAVHQELLFLTVHTVRVPWLPLAEQVHVERLKEHVFRLTMRHGFMQIPEIPKVLPACAASGLMIPLSDATYFLSRISALATPLPGMVLWREGLFIFLEKISQRASSYFHLPADQVVEIGIVIEI
jgi:KUP system potassium uptake protein